MSEKAFRPWEVDQVSLLLYSLCRGVYSSRKIEQACEERIDFMAVTGIRGYVATGRQKHGTSSATGESEPKGPTDAGDAAKAPLQNARVGAGRRTRPGRATIRRRSHPSRRMASRLSRQPAWHGEAVTPTAC